MLTDSQIKGIFTELIYSTSRSGGKGGQNVNKVETKVTLTWLVNDSFFISEVQKKKITAATGPQIQISSSEHRSQLENKETARKKMLALIQKILRPVKKRKATKPSRASKLRKSESKRRQSEKKDLRKKLF